MDIHRFEDQIRQLEQHPVRKDKVLLYGSSFLANWGYETVRRQWLEATDGALKVVDHGFGGATVEELLYHYHRLVTPYAPKAVVLRTGLNDIYYLKPEQAFFLTRLLIGWLKADYPGIRIVVIKCFDTPWATPEFTRELWRYNEMMETFAEEDPQVLTVDLDFFMYRTKADIGTMQNFRDIFLPDGLHLTPQAYAELSKVLAPQIQRLLTEVQL